MYRLSFIGLVPRGKEVGVVIIVENLCYSRRGWLGVGLFHEEVFEVRNLMKDQPAKKRRGLVLTVLKGYDTPNPNKNAHALSFKYNYYVQRKSMSDLPYSRILKRS